MSLSVVSARFKCVFDQKTGVRDGMQQRVPDELGVDPPLAVEGLLEGEDDEHLVDSFLDPAEAAALPGPELGRDEPDDRDPGATQVLREPEVDVGEVDEDSDVGTPAADRADQAAVAGVDAGDVAQDLRDAHDGDIFGADGALLSGLFHLGAAEPGKTGVGQSLAES